MITARCLGTTADGTMDHIGGLFLKGRGNRTSHMGLPISPAAHLVDTGHWQAMSGVPQTKTIELQNVAVAFETVPTGVDALKHYWSPNLPFAEAQFLDRVSGEPLNPPPSHKLWPWTRHNEQHQDSAVREMDQTDWAYLAALIDGEGCIHMKETTSGHIGPRLTITQKDDQYLQRVVDKFNVGTAKVVSREARPTRPASRRLVWTITAREDIRWVLNGVMPFLDLKRPRAEDALAALPDEPRRNTRPQHVDRTRKGEARFSHSYPERMWPPRGHGVRYPYGNLNDLVDLLVREPYTRQAYLPIWFPEDGHAAAVAGERVPCTLGYHFMLRDGKLHIFYPMRSLDFLRYMRDDCYMATRLGLWIIEQCRRRSAPDNEQGRDNLWDDVKPGHLNVFASSLHIFEGDLQTMEREYGHVR